MKIAIAEVKILLAEGVEYTGEFIGINAKMCKPGMQARINVPILDLCGRADVFCVMTPSTSLSARSRNSCREQPTPSPIGAIVLKPSKAIHKRAMGESPQKSKVVHRRCKVRSLPFRRTFRRRRRGDRPRYSAMTSPPARVDNATRTAEAA